MLIGPRKRSKCHHYYITVLASLLLMIMAHHESVFGQARVPMRKCNPHHHDDTDSNRISCLCTKEYCDNLVFEWPRPGYLLQIESDEFGKRFETQLFNLRRVRKQCPSRQILSSRHNNHRSQREDIEQCLHINHQHDDDDTNNQIDNSSWNFDLTVNTSERFQEILGWGGAFTDSSLININSLSNRMSRRLMNNYFGADGLRYNIGRVPVGGSDFSNRTYSYNDVDEPDYEQKNWTLAPEDTNLKIPFISMAKKIAKKSWGGDIKLFASCWSPPKWMKTNNDFVRGHLKGPSIEEGKVYRAYAHYLLKFIKAYKDHSLGMWGMTLQNEPGSSYLPAYFFNSLQFSPEDQVHFIKYHLGPLLDENGFDRKNFKLILGDDSLGIVNIVTYGIFQDEVAKKYVSGLAFHWYLSGMVPYSFLDRWYENHKDDVEFVIMSEACSGSAPLSHNVLLGDWSRGASYANDIIEDLNRNVAAWVDWNLALDLQGGPNWAKNFADSPIIVDIERDRFYKNPMYYALGHFSRFILPGSTRVGSSIKENPKLSEANSSYMSMIGLGGSDQSVIGTSFILPGNKHISIVLMNTSDKTRELRLNINHDKWINSNNLAQIFVTLGPKSITTLVYGL